MNSHVHKYYRKYVDEEVPVRLFHEVIPLHEDSVLSWEELHEKVPALPRGWYELSQLKSQDRIEFVCGFWLSTLPFVPYVQKFLKGFFNSLDDIGVFAYQWKPEDAFECEMVYSLKDGSCFYHGRPSCTEKELFDLNRQYRDELPQDYLDFLQIHNGFGKHTDTGLIRSSDVPALHHRLMKQMEEKNVLIALGSQIVEVEELIPFYESFGKGSYQCFYRGWCPDLEMGNVYFCPREKAISDFRDPRSLQDNLAFSHFLDWLVFYLESIS